MSGYCRDCGNTLCICKLINSNVSIEEHHKTYEELYFESLKIVGKLGQQLREAKAEIEDLYSGRLGACHTCEQVAELNIKSEQQLKECRKHLTESVARECKCKTNVSVNNDLVNRNLKLKQQLKEASEVIFNINNKSVGKEYGLDAEDLWELSEGYINKYKVKE